MIPDYGKYYGCVFSTLIENWSTPHTISKIEIGMQGVYLIDNCVPLFIKFSRNRKGPWTFTFQTDHQALCKVLAEQFADCIVALVCGSDGIVALKHQHFQEVLETNLNGPESIIVRRKLRHMYSVGGTSGRLATKVSRESLILLVEELLSEKRVKQFPSTQSA